MTTKPGANSQRLVTLSKLPGFAESFDAMLNENKILTSAEVAETLNASLLGDDTIDEECGFTDSDPDTTYKIDASQLSDKPMEEQCLPLPLSYHPSQKNIYSEREAQKYLDALNERYPLKEVLEKNFDKLQDKKWISNIFKHSFVNGSKRMVEYLTDILKSSVKAGKRMSVPYKDAPCYGTDILEFENIGLRKAVDYNAIGFYQREKAESIDSQVHMMPKETLILHFIYRHTK